MADGDNARSPIRKNRMLDRGWPDKSSYFFNPQVQRCLSEQSKVFRAKLAEKEIEAKISYEKSLSDNFGADAQINAVFNQLLFDSDAPMNFDVLIDELRALADKEKDSGRSVTRLLDLLFVTRNTGVLSHELKIRKTSYDLRSEEAEAQGNFGVMTTFTKLMSNSSVRGAGPKTTQMSLVLSMIATGKQEIVAAALMYLANGLGCPWDALVLARFFYGNDHEVTRMMHEAWTEAVMTDDQFRMIKISRSLDNCNLKDVAQDLIDGMNNKKAQSPADLLDAYRCLAIAMASNPSLSEFEMKLEAADVSKLMMSLYVTALGWGRTGWAKIMMADISKRAPPAAIPSDICQIGLICHIELVDLLHKLLGIVAPEEHSHESQQEEGSMLQKLALHWRTEINREGGEMSKLKTKNAARKKILDDWIVQLSTVLRAPLFEEWTELNKKMECVFLAAEFFPQMLRWAATGQEGEPLRVTWPEPELSFTIEDESIVVAELVTGPRSRSISIGSSRSAATTTKEEGKKQKKKEKEEAKEEQLPSGPAQDKTQTAQRPSGPAQEKTQTAQRTEGNPQHQERAVPPPRDLSVLQPLSQSTRHASYPPQYNQSGGGGVHGHTMMDTHVQGRSYQNTRDNGRWADGGAPTQDVRRNTSFSGEGREQNGGNAHYNAPASHLSPKTPYVGSPRGGLAHSPHGGHSTGSAPSTSPSVSNHDLASKIDQYCSSPEMIPVVASLIDQKKKQEKMSAQPNAAAPSTTEQKQPVNGGLTKLHKQQSQTTPQPSSPVTPRPKSTPEDVTPEMLQSKLAESMKKSAEAKAAQQTTSGQQSPPASPPSQHALPQQPTMGTAAIQAARARRSLESVQPVEQASVESSEPQPEQQMSEPEQPVQQSQSEPQLAQSEQQQQPQMQSVPLADSQYEELMGQMEQKDGDNDRSIAPEPAEMNKLFTGNNKGQAMLPPVIIAEEAAAAAAAAEAATSVPPVPALVAAAAESVAAPSQSSLNLTQLSPSEGLVLPPDDDGQHMRAYASSSDQGMLTPITEVSQETFGTKSTALSESDAPGLDDESPDNVFEDNDEKNQIPLHVDVQLPPLPPRPILESEEIREIGTPNIDNLCSESYTPLWSTGGGQSQEEAFSLAPMQTVSSSATDRSEQTTVVPTTSHEMGVRSEAQDANQLHQSILAPVPPAETVQHSSTAVNVETMGGGQTEVATVAESTTTTTTSVMEQSGHETTQAQTAMLPEMAASAAPTMQPLQQQSAITRIWDPKTPPQVSPAEMQPVQQHQSPVQQQLPQMTQSPMPAVTMDAPFSSSQPSLSPPVEMPPAQQQQVQTPMQQQPQQPLEQQQQTALPQMAQPTMPAVSMDAPVISNQAVPTPVDMQPVQQYQPIMQQQQAALPQMTQSPMPEASVSAPVSSSQPLQPSPVAPAVEMQPVQQFQTSMQQQPQQPMMQQAQPVPLPSVTPVEMPPVQQHQPPVQQPQQIQTPMQQQQTMQQAQFVQPSPVAPVEMPPAQQYQQVQTPMQQQQQPAMQQAQPVIAHAWAPTGVENVMTQPSQSATSQQSMNSQYSSPSYGQQQQQQPVYPMETPMAAMQQQQRPIAHDATEQAVQQASLAADAELNAEMVVVREDQPAPMPAPAGEQLNVDCGEVKELVTSCGVAYKYSPVKNEEANQAVASMGVEAVQQQPMQESIQAPSFMDSLLGGVGTITTTEIDEHAATRRQEASEWGDAASEIGSSSALHPFPESYSMPPSMPSTAFTTPDHTVSEQQFVYNSESNTPENPCGDNPYGDQGSAHSFSTTSATNENSQQQQQYQQQPTFNQVQQQPMQPTFQQAQQPLTTADSAPQQTLNIPVWVDPFEQPQQQQQQSQPQQQQKFIMQPQQQPQQNTVQPQHQSGGGFGDMNTGGTPAPCFGTLSNVDQNPRHQPDHAGLNQSQSFGHKNYQDRGNQNRSSFRGPSGQGGTRGDGRGSGDRRGGSGFEGGRRGERRGGRGGSFGAPAGFSQDPRGGNNQQQSSGFGQSGAGFEGGDSGHQKSFQQQNQGGNFGGQGAGSFGGGGGRGGSGGATAGASRGRGTRGFNG